MKNFYTKNSVLYLHVTDLCNLKCTHCYGKQNPNPISMTFESVVEYWEKINYLFGEGKFNHILLHGGEPLLLGYDNIYKIINFLSSRVEKIWIQTNATLIDDKFLDLFIKHKVSIGTSYDYNTNRVYNVDHLKYIRSKTCRFGCVITLTNDFLDTDYDKLIQENLVEVGYTTINFEFLKSVDINDVKNFPSEEKIIKFFKFFYNKFYNKFKFVNPIKSYLYNYNIPCEKGNCYKNYLAINSIGDLFHCNFLTGANKLSFGNINNDIHIYKNKDIFLGNDWKGCPIRSAVCNRSTDIYANVKKRFLEEIK